MRDMRDPQALGEAYLKARKLGAPIGDAVHMPSRTFKSDESCIEKYGSANDVKPKFVEVRVR